MNSSKVLNNSQLNNSALNLNDLSIEKIQEFILLLEEHQITCVKSGKFVEAELAKQRVVQLKEIEKEKHLNEIKIQQEEDKFKLDIDQKQELESMNRKWDEKIKESQDKFKELHNALLINQEEEIQSFLEVFDQNYPSVKPSSELLNLNKILDNLIKKKDYMEAHNVQTKLSQLTKIEYDKHLEEKDKRRDKEIEKIRQKQKIETDTLEAKIKSKLNEITRSRGLEFEKLLLNYQNRVIQLERDQKMQIIENTKKINPAATLKRPTSRLNSNSASKVLDK